MILATVLKNPGLVPCRRLQNYSDEGPPRYQRQSRYLRRDELGNEEFMSNKRNNEILN